MRNNNISSITSRGGSKRNTKMEDSFVKKKEKKSKFKNNLLSSYESEDMDNATKEKKMWEELDKLDKKYMLNNEKQEEESIFI